MHFTDNDIFQLVEGIWSSMLDLQVKQDDDAAGADGTRPFMTGCVQISGGWEGAVTLECSAVLATRAAELMFAMEPGEASEDEVRDALGELTNMTGGNIKSLVPGPSTLSLPAVTEGTEYLVLVPGTEVVTRVGFACEGEPMLVTIFEKSE
jgi:chemotaxis protein CheX